MSEEMMHMKWPSTEGTAIEPKPRTQTLMGFKVIEDERVPVGFMEIRDQDGRVSGLVFIGYPNPGPATSTA